MGQPVKVAAGFAWSRVVFSVLAGSVAVVPLVVARWRPDPFSLPKLTVLWVILVICVVVAAVGVFVGGADEIRFTFHRHVDVPLAAFALFNVAATVFSSDPGQSLIGERRQYQGLLTTLLYLSFFLLARLLVNSTFRLKILFSAVSVGAAVVATYGILQRQGIDPVWRGASEVQRVFASIGQSNALAAYLVLAVPLSLVMARRARVSGVVIAVIAASVMTIAVLMTESRGGMLGLSVSVALLGLTWRRWTVAGISRNLVSGFILLLVVSPVFLVPPVRSLLSDSWDRSASVADLTSDISGKDHWDVWVVSTHVALDNPLLGTGPETFPDVFAEHSREALSVDRAIYFDAFRVESPHNFLLVIAAGSGIPALVAFLWFLTAVVLTLTFSRRVEPVSAPYLRAVVVVIVGFMVTNSFITPDFSSTWLLWVLMGAAFGVVDGSPNCHGK